MLSPLLVTGLCLPGLLLLLKLFPSYVCSTARLSFPRWSSYSEVTHIRLTPTLFSSMKTSKDFLPERKHGLNRGAKALLLFVHKARIEQLFPRTALPIAHLKQRCTFQKKFAPLCIEPSIPSNLQPSRQLSQNLCVLKWTKWNTPVAYHK